MSSVFLLLVTTSTGTYLNTGIPPNPTVCDCLNMICPPSFIRGQNTSLDLSCVSAVTADRKKPNET